MKVGNWALDYQGGLVGDVNKSCFNVMMREMSEWNRFKRERRGRKGRRFARKGSKEKRQ